MTSEITSTFKDKPKFSITWWAMGFGLATVLLGPFLGMMASFIVPWVTRTFGRTTGRAFGFNTGISGVVLTIAAITFGIISLRKGERSWALWLGFIPAVLTGAFFLFMIVGEFVYPH
jgi:predicted membrane protein